MKGCHPAWHHAAWSTPAEVSDIYLLAGTGCNAEVIARRADVPMTAALWHATDFLDQQGFSLSQQAEQLRVSKRTVERYRARRKEQAHAA